jgi:D-inositol-3-phosphate glycosyltransferase
MTKGRVVMGLVFFPRGGSAQVTRYLAAALSDAGWSVSLVTGSFGAPGEGTHAATFFAGTHVHYLDYTPAVEAFEAGASAMAAPEPMHASFEDREDAPDVVLAAVYPALAEHLSSVWEPPFLAAGAAEADVFHLYHLTPQHDAVARRWPRVPVVAHLHGTEIKLIEAIEERVGVATALGTTLGAMPELVRDTARVPAGLDERQRDLLRTTRWDQWRHGDFWLARLRDQARRADHLVVVSPPDRVSAIAVFGVAPERVTDIPNGVDTARFRPRPLTAAERRARVRRWLVEDP